jgi:hypothetical protein
MAMAGTTELPESIDVDGLGYVVHRFSYFSSNVLPELIPVDGLTVSGVEAYSTASGSAFRGTLENGLELTLENPNVTIFPTNRVGRPLGMATGSAMIQLGPGETWSFETTQLNDTGVDHLVYPRASVLAQ